MSKSKVIAAVFYLGIILLIMGFWLWAYANVMILYNEQRLNSPTLTQEEKWRFEGSLKWWKTARVTTYNPTAIALITIGLIAVLYTRARMHANLVTKIAISLYSFLVFLAFTFQLALPVILSVIFFIFVPGYIITETFSLGKSNLEKLSFSIGLSLAILLGVRGIAQITNLKGILSELVVVSFLAATLSIKLLLNKKS